MVSTVCDVLGRLNASFLPTMPMPYGTTLLSTGGTCFRHLLQRLELPPPPLPLPLTHPLRPKTSEQGHLLIHDAKTSRCFCDCFRLWSCAATCGVYFALHTVSLCGRLTRTMIVMMITMIMSVCTCQSIIHMRTICVVHTRAHECAHCFTCLLPYTYPSCRCATGIGDKEELEPRDLGEPMPPPFRCPHTKKEASLAATAVVVTCFVNQLGQHHHAQTQTPKEIDHYREHKHRGTYPH